MFAKGYKIYDLKDYPFAFWTPKDCTQAARYWLATAELASEVKGFKLTAILDYALIKLPFTKPVALNPCLTHPVMEVRA